MRVRRTEEPRYVAVDGPPGSGASALARRLAAATGATLYADPAPGNPFRDDFARAPERFAFQTQTYCLLTRYRQQVELAQPDLFSPSGAVADYLFARDELFARVTLRTEELHLYQRIHQLLDARIPRPDLVVYLTAARDALRARLRQLGQSADRVIKLSVFERLADLMDERFFAWDECPLLILDTTGGDVEEPGRLDETIDLIRKTRAGVQYVRLA